jgi:hypothetical protein
MKESIEQEARKFFRDFQGYYEELLTDFPSRKKLRWWHKLLGTKPRGAIYEEVVEGCKTAIEALGKNDIDAVVSVLDKLIQWYESEIQRFSESIWEVQSNAEIKATVNAMEYLKKKLLESK